MSSGKVFPKTKLKKADVLAAEGALKVGCIVKDGKILPAINSATRLAALSEKASASWYSRLMGRNIVYTQNRLYSAPDALISPIAVNFAAASPSMVETFLNKMPIAYVFGDTTYFRFSGLNYSSTFKGNVVNCVLKNGRIFGTDPTLLNSTFAAAGTQFAPLFTTSTPPAVAAPVAAPSSTVAR